MTSVISFWHRRKKITAPKLLKFGTISEDADGRLVFDGFSIDGGNQPGLSVHEALVGLVIARLRDALDQDTC